jgi:outer membrane protein assembly factor BamB
MVTYCLQSQAGVASSEDRSRLADLQASASRRLDSTRDLVGIRKQAVLATASGTLFALNLGDGRVLWHSQLEPDGLPLVALKVARLPHKKEEDIEVRTLLCKPS